MLTTDNYTAETTWQNPEFLVGGNKIICLSYHDSALATSVSAQPLCRINYSTPTGNLSINSAIEIVNKLYEAIQKVVSATCITMNIGVGVSQVSKTDHYFSVIPNPSTDLIQLVGRTSLGGESLIQITDVAGRLLYSEKIILNDVFSHSINMMDYQSGVYYNTLSSKSGTATKPVIIVK